MNIDQKYVYFTKVRIFPLNFRIRVPCMCGEGWVESFILSRLPENIGVIHFKKCRGCGLTTDMSLHRISENYRIIEIDPEAPHPRDEQDILMRI